MGQEAVLNEMKRVLNEHVKVARLYLFGSRASGTYDAGSDYDIAVVSPDFEGLSFSERQALVRPIVRKVLGTVPIDVVCYTEEEYERGKKAFLPSLIEEEGIPA